MSMVSSGFDNRYPTLKSQLQIKILKRDISAMTTASHDASTVCFSVAEMVYAVDALDLLLTCIDFLAMASPLSASQKSQENMDPMEDPDETRIDCTPQMAEMRLADGQTDGDRVSSPSSSSLADSLKRCGDALQRYLESPLAASMLAFTITTDGCRSAVLRLLRVALSLPNFSTKRLVYCIHGVALFNSSQVLGSGGVLCCSRLGYGFVPNEEMNMIY